MTIGVYAIQNRTANRVYIGSSSDIQRRLICHKSYLRNGNHPAMIRALRGTKPNVDEFEFSTVCETDTIEQARELEELLLQETPADRLYNIAKDATGGKAKRVNLGAYRAGAAKRNADPEYRERLSVACKGKRAIVTCPKCGVSGGGGNMRRYHFKNCKQ